MRACVPAIGMPLFTIRDMQQSASTTTNPAPFLNTPKAPLPVQLPFALVAGCWRRHQGGESMEGMGVVEEDPSESETQPPEWERERPPESSTAMGILGQRNSELGEVSEIAVHCGHDS